MKKKLLVVCLTILSLSISAQILPVEQLNEATGKVSDQIEGIRHIKDVNGVLDKFEGTWIGQFNGKQIKIVIKKFTRDHSVYVERYHPEPLLWDELIGKYELKDQNGSVIESNLDLPDDSLEVLTKHFYHNPKVYSLRYYGTEGRCGDNGYLFLWYRNATTMDLTYSFQGETASDCTVQAEKSLPITGKIILTKQ